MSDTKTMVPDKDALARVGREVRKRLKADRRVHKIPTDDAEIFALGEFATPNECQRLMHMIDVVAVPSTLYAGTEQEGFRTSYSGNFDSRDPFVAAISRRMDDTLGLKSALGETIQGQRYLPGQQFKPHHDFFFPGQSYWEDERRRGGQRSWTAMLFLNDVPAGGETEFPKLELAITPKEGVLLMWNNAGPDGVPNLSTLHAGTPVVEGAKYVITKWYRTRKWG